MSGETFQGESCFVKKSVWCDISFPNSQREKFGLLAFFSASLSKFFPRHREEIGQICFLKKRCFSNVSEHLKNLDAVKQTSETTSSKFLLRALCKISVKLIIFVKFHQSSFWDNFWKKLGLSAKSFWGLLCFSHLWEKCFLCVQRNVWWNFFPNNEFSLFWTLKEKNFGYLEDVFRKSLKTTVFVSRGTFCGKHFQREIRFQNFLYLSDGNSTFREFFFRRFFKSFSSRQSSLLGRDLFSRNFLELSSRK